MHAPPSSPLQVRTRLHAWEMQRERDEELLGAQGLWEAVQGLVDLEEEEEGEEEESY